MCLINRTSPKHTRQQAANIVKEYKKLTP